MVFLRNPQPYLLLTSNYSFLMQAHTSIYIIPQKSSTAILSITQFPLCSTSPGMKAVHASLSPSPSCFSHKAQVLKHGSSSKYNFPSLYIHQITFASPSHSVARLPCSTTAAVLTPIYVDFPSLGTTRFHIRSSLSRLALKAKSYEARPDDRTLGVVPFSHLTAEREEAKAVLSLFLKKQGYSSTVASRIVKKSEFFIDHLTSKLQSFYKSWYLVGRELSTVEIRNVLIPYLESLREENGDLLIQAVKSFPNPAGIEKDIPTPTAISFLGKKERAVARVCQVDADGLRPTNVAYLMNLGMELEQIKGITRRFPAFAYYTLDRKIKPLVEFLLDLGIDRSDIPTILHKRPQLCGISLDENLKPTMAFLETYGVDKTRWAKVIYRFPAILTYSRQKVKASVDFLCELGVSQKNIGKILTRCPHITSYSVEEKLRPTAEYFRSMGIDPASLVHRCPQTFGLSVDLNLRPVTEFFLKISYSVEDMATMVSRYGALYTFSLPRNIVPKWEYFLAMDYPRSELVKFPHYFGYSLNERIKPRYGMMKENNVKLILNQMLSTSNCEFEKIVERKMSKLTSPPSSVE